MTFTRAFDRAVFVLPDRCYLSLGNDTDVLLDVFAALHVYLLLAAALTFSTGNPSGVICEVNVGVDRS